MFHRAATFSLLLTFGVPEVASAHGRPPFVGDLKVHPTDPDTLVARATWGLVLSEDGGESWHWICAAVTGADPTREDPAILVLADGSILVGTFDGLARSRPDRCEWTYPDAQLTDVFVIDLDARRAEPDTVYAVATSGIEPDQLYRSTDQGRSFEPVGAPIEGILLERVRVAPSDANRVYLSGANPSGPSGEREAYLLRSDDAARTFTEISIPLEDGERNVHLFAVDPTDPDRVLLRITRRITDDRPERLLLTQDGGTTFVTVLLARDLSDAAFSETGATAWASSRTLDGLFRSDDGGRSFTALAEGNLTCVEAHGDRLFTCVDELRDGYALGRSADQGTTIDPILHFSEIYELPDCPRCTAVGYVCPEWFPDLAFDLRLDASTPPPSNGMTGGPRDAAIPAECTEGGAGGMDGGMGGGTPPTDPSGCACRATPTSPRGGWLPLLLLFGLGVLRARPGG